MFQWYACRAHAFLAEWDQTIERCEKSIASNAALAEFQKRYQGLTVQKYLGPPVANQKVKIQKERLAEGLRKAGLPER